MPELFEKYVGRCVCRALAPWRVRLQSTGHSALEDSEGPLFALRPDVVVESPSGAIVLDTKWKELKPDDKRKLGVVQDDIYQMLVYGQAYKAMRLVLLYPWRTELKKDPGVIARWHVEGTERHLHVATVNVGEPRSVVDALREIVCDERHQRSQLSTQSEERPAA